MLDIRKFVTKIAKQYLENNVDKQKLSNYDLPQIFCGFDFTQHFVYLNRYVYGTTFFGTSRMSQEKINIVCESFKSIFMDLLNLKAKLMIEEVEYLEEYLVDEIERRHDESVSIYRISWVVFLE